MRKQVLILALSLFFVGSCPAWVSAQNAEAKMSIDNYHHYYRQGEQTASPEKRAFIEEYRQYLYKSDWLYSIIANQYKLKELIALLQEDGRFSDLDDSTVGVSTDGNLANSGGVVTEGYNRLWFLAHAFKTRELSAEDGISVWTAFRKAVVHYGKLEISRPNNWTRFHSSCFAIPKAAVAIYFSLLPWMDAVEKGECKDLLSIEACDMLKIIGLQTWTQPLREDDTDLNVVQIERFRNHVWWVGGNGLGSPTGYRSVFQVAFMLHSVAMVDLLAEVAQRGISATSQPTYKTSFWNEGFTVDGAGWGHGKQCLIWGYPIDGTFGALEMLTALKHSPWKARLDRGNIETLLNYFRGSNFYYYKGYTIPCLDRNSMAYKTTQTIPYKGLLNQVLLHWKDALTPAEQQELEQLRQEVEKKDIRMSNYSAYNGTRWFFNNDDLVKKTEDCFIMVNMASNRCDGIESAHGFADRYNFYTTDGTTFFEKSGDEYRPVIGGFDVTAMPGITAREGMAQLMPVTNWRGYTSKHNFAAASTTGGENAVAGYLFEKMNGSEREDVNDRGDNIGQNVVIYGVKAYKGYFMLGDYFVALGAGITNLQPEQPGVIRTTLDQTAHTGDIRVVKGRKSEWIAQQGKFAYSVLPQYKHKLQYVCERRKADWAEMNASNSGKKGLPEQVDILHLWIDHGQRPIDDKYGYVVYTGNNEPADAYPFCVLRNDTQVQAIRSTDGQVVEAIFYDPSSSLKVGKLKLQVSAPCTLLLEQIADGYRATLTDAEMDVNRKEIVLTVNGRQVSVRMPQGKLCGKPVSVKVSIR